MTGRSICIILTDPLKVFEQKGEIKNGYYNPQNYFEKVIFISFTSCEAGLDTIRTGVGNAKAFVFTVGEIKVTNFFDILVRIFRIIKKEKPLIIRAYDPSFRGFISVLIGKFLKIPVVISLHVEFDDQRKFDKRFSLRLRKIMELICIRFADSVICVTDYVKRYALRYGAKCAVTIYNGVNIVKFHISAKESSSGDNLVLSVGRLVPQKYQECLIRAVAPLNVKLLLIGDGYLFDDLYTLTKKLGAENKVNFIRAVPNREIQRYYAMAKVFAIATRYEGFCIPVIEAMAAGVPVVASRIPPIEEIVGSAGILVENNEHEFRDKIELLLGNEKLREELAERGRAQVLKFDINANERKQVMVYDELIKTYCL
jgi:glycosyltransferase involved in cell wall biosynthesis